MIALTEITFDNWRRFRMLSPEEWRQWMDGQKTVPPIYDQHADTPTVGFMQTWVDQPSSNTGDYNG